MGYEAIHIQGPEIPDFAATLHQAREEQRQRENDRWTQMMQGQQSHRADQELGIQQGQFGLQQKKYAQGEEDAKNQATLQAQELRSAGLVHQAEIIEQMHGIQVAPAQPQGAVPQEPQAPGPQPDIHRFEEPGPYAPGKAPVMGPGDIEHKMRAAWEGASSPEDAAARPSPEQLNALIQQRQQEAEQAYAGARDWKAQNEAYPGQMRDYQTKLAGYQAEQQNPTVAYNIGGHQVPFDPREKQRAAESDNQRRAALVMQALKADPNLAPYATSAGAMAAAGLADPKAIIADTDALAKANAERAAKVKRDETYEMTAPQKFEVGMHKGEGGSPASRPVNPVEATMRGILTPDGANDQKAYEYAAHHNIPQGTAHQIIADYHTNAGKTGREQRSETALDVNLPDGTVATATSAPAAAKATAANLEYGRMRDRLQALIQDVQQHGNREWTVPDTQRRNSLYAEALAAKRKYENLGVAKAWNELDKQIFAPQGTLGHGLLTGANPDVLQHVLQGADQYHVQQMHAYLKGGGPRDDSGGIHKVTMPDGSVREFDATGKRVK